MKLKASEVFAAYLTLNAIVSEKRALPQAGKFLIGRAFRQLRPDFTEISEERDALIAEFGEDEMAESPDGAAPTGKKLVKPNSPNAAKFAAAWKVIADRELEVAVEPVPLDTLGSEGTIEAHEFDALGDLVVATK